MEEIGWGVASVPMQIHSYANLHAALLVYLCLHYNLLPHLLLSEMLCEACHY